MKQFNRTKYLALLGGALLGTAWLPRVATAKPFPKPGYILKDKDTADIGRRSSRNSGNRAAMRMLARLMRQNPDEGGACVTWKFPLSNGKIQNASITFHEYEHLFDAYEGRYVGVTRQMIYAVAKRSGTSLDLPFHGAISFDHPIKINLGKQPSYDAGSRATIQVMARSFRNARAAEYQIRWNSTVSNGQSKDFLISYVSTEGTSVDVDVASSLLQINVNESKEQDMEIQASYSNVSKKKRVQGC